MTVFWSLAAGMVMVALLFVLPPLLRKRKVSAVSRDDLNTKVIKEQLAELEADLAAGKLDKAQFDAARKDLERELLYDLDSVDSVQMDIPERSGRWLTLLLIPAIPLCAVLLYQLMGAAELIDVLQQSQLSQPEPDNKQSAHARALDEMAAQLSERLRSKPDDLQGWVMLAKTYNVLQRYDSAINAYENALRLGGSNDPGLLADYADALVITNNGNFTDEAGVFLLRALELQPDNVKALWLSGHWKNQSGMYSEAINYWQKASLLLPDNSQDKLVITRQIQHARQQLGIIDETGQPTATSPVNASQDKSASKVTLQVHVSINPALLSRTNPEDTVFIFARAVQGPRMPLAIARTQVKDLPVNVSLDDSMAMTPQMVLSRFDQVTVGARVSKSGNAMPRSGDLQGSLSPVHPATAGNIEITISTVLP